MFLVLTTAMFIVVGCTDATVPAVLLSEDFSGTAGADLTTKGWSHASGAPIVLSTTTIDEGNSGDPVAVGSYTSYAKALSSPVNSLADGDQLIVTASFTFSRAHPTPDKGWFRPVSFYETGETMGPSMHIHIEEERGGGVHVDFAGNGGVDFSSGELFCIDAGNLQINTLYDMRVMIAGGTPWDTISYWWKPRSNGTWNHLYSTTPGTYTLNPIDRAGIDGNSRFNGLIDTISVTLTPEPATLALLLLGGLAMLRRRRSV